MDIGELAPEPSPTDSLAPTEGPLTPEELELAFRNKGMPLEGLRYEVTPVGMHYVVVHFDVPPAESGAWVLEVGGRVRRRLEMTLNDIRAMPSTTMAVTMECAGNGRGHLNPRPLSIPWLGGAVGNAEWTGTPLAGLLDLAGVGGGAVDVAFTGADRGIQGEQDQYYSRGLTLEEAQHPGVLIAYEMNGRALEPQHGFPLRLVVPGWYGMASVKWLRSIEILDRPFEGYQQSTAYRYQQTEEDLGEPVRRIRVRALMLPPGVPDFFSRRRVVEPGPVRLSGRAWSGSAPIARVEVGIDGRWREAILEPEGGLHAWSGWHFNWDADPGEHDLACRATDATGATQPLETPWNYQGMGNNAVQRLQVTVGT